MAEKRQRADFLEAAFAQITAFVQKINARTRDASVHPLEIFYIDGNRKKIFGRRVVEFP